MNSKHVPVLADEISQLVKFETNAVIVDCTVGYGGHSRILGEHLDDSCKLIGFDVDRKCLEVAKKNLDGLRCGVILKKNNFCEISQILKDEGIDKVDFVLADLGWCSGQVIDAEKGFSFQENQPLDMRLDPELQQTAADIVNQTKESDLADLIYKYGQERASRRIARFIAEFRRNQPIKSTGQLSFIICRALGKMPGQKGLHPATRTFQALRIAVNSELENLESLLEQMPDLLKPGGRVAIISFHSLEDRIVKQDFLANKKAGKYEILTKKPTVPDREEIGTNPRSRSAKLRVAQRI